MANKVKGNKVDFFYVMAIINKETGKRIAYKIGETVNITKRMSAEKAYYTKAYGKQIEMRVLYTKECESKAKGIACESIVRAHQILENPKAYRDTDRFISRKNWDMQEIDNLLKNIR